MSSPLDDDAHEARDIRPPARHNIAPIEVKSGKRYTLSSLRKFVNLYAEQLYVPYVIHTDDYRSVDGIEYLPVYMTGLL